MAKCKGMKAKGIDSAVQRRTQWAVLREDRESSCEMGALRRESARTACAFGGSSRPEANAPTWASGNGSNQLERTRKSFLEVQEALVWLATVQNGGERQMQTAEAMAGETVNGAAIARLHACLAAQVLEELSATIKVQQSSAASVFERLERMETAHAPKWPEWPGESPD